MGPLAAPAIDWDMAQRVGELVAGSPPYGGAPARSVQPLAYDFARRVSAYTGLALPAELPPLESVDRPRWIAANLQTMRPLLDPLLERNVSGLLRTASGYLLGAQVGALTGVLSQRVLGQYDLSLLDDSTPPRLLLLAPNLTVAARNLGVDRDELTTWVAIHEITHAVQFSGAPWLREHLGGLLRELIDGLQVTLAGHGGDNDDNASTGTHARVPDVRELFERARGIDPRELFERMRHGELRELLERARHGELLRITLGEERWRLVERMQATMSLIEGHAEHTMDAVGAEVLPSLPRLRAAMTRRREAHRGLPWRVLERLLGLELKLRQYEVGRRFCDAVVETGGTEALAVAWQSPELLPTLAELEAPDIWLARTNVRNVTS